MPYSYDYFKIDFKHHLELNFSSLHILDVGPGSGSYGSLLRDKYTIDGIEIYEPYIEQFKLNEIYNKLFIGNILDFDFSQYDYLILGDVLEHIDEKTSQMLIQKIYNLGIYCMVAVPYQMPQGEVGGNVYEAHLQDDLTHSIIYDRFPLLDKFKINTHYGMYLNYNFI